VKLRLVSCPLCDRLSGPAPLEEGLHGRAIPDGFPVGPSHTLVVPRRHESNLFALAPEELHTDDFTVGANVGVAAGQTVLHAHIHVIPRFAGDVPDPRGGIRWVIPSRAAYW
jgi:diadenosine tetraphosphate (Ap4A) HIT family hydrolase